MNKTVVISSKVLAMMMTMQLATMTAAAHPMKESDFNVPFRKHVASAISVFTYAAGGPRSRANKGPRLVDDAVVRIRKPNSGGRLIREVKRTMNGHIVFSVRPGVYRIEAAIEPPEATPRIPCNGPKVVRVHQDRKTLVKLYCPVR
jgi:hypothetical protein